MKLLKYRYVFILLFIFIAVLVPVNSVSAAGPLERDYTYGMDSTRAAFCKSATTKPASSANPQRFIDECIFKVVGYCNNFAGPMYKNACYGKFFNLGDCRQSGTGVAEEQRVKACRDRNTFICAGQPHAVFKEQCQSAGKSQLFGIVVLNPEGGGTAAGGGQMPENEDTTPTEVSAEEEDQSFTNEEIDEARDELREGLTRGDESCGSSKTVFNFNCRPGVDNPILGLVFAIVTFLTYGVGIILTLSIVISGIQYATAQGDTNTVHKARMRIFNAVIALLLYIFAFAILNYLVPGGLIG